MNINFGLHSQRKGGFKFMRYQPHIARLVIPLSAEHGHGLSRSLSGLWVNPFSRWAVRLYCHNQLCVPTC